MLGFAFMMGVVISVVLPTRREFAHVSSEQGTDAYSLAYLSVVTRADPRDAQLALAYAKQLGAIGRWDDALGALPSGYALASTAGKSVVDETRALRLDLLLARARSKPEGDPVRAEGFLAARRELRAGVGLRWSATRTRELATLALELEDPALAAEYYLALAELETSPQARADALVSAGVWQRASGSASMAIASFQRAASAATDPQQRTAALQSAADTMEADERPCDAANVMTPLARTTKDLAVVARATQLETSCGRANEARWLGRKLLDEASRGDEEALRAQVRRELAAGDPTAALALLQTLARLHPGDLALHQETARVAEWAGQPQVALEHWLFSMASPSTLAVATNPDER